jgi:hypothetical protein
MKILSAIILISAVNLAWACGPYYPYGDDVRFSLFRPRVFPLEGLNTFQYSTASFLPDDESVRAGENLNIVLWNTRCGLSLDHERIHEAVYGDNAAYLTDFLKKRKDQAAVDYLKFAKQCSDFNRYFDDPWERNEQTSIPKRSQLIKKALKKATIKDTDLSQRYAFLAIRMAYYNSDSELIRTTYTKYFEAQEKKNVIDYWAMYFLALTESDDARKSYYAAQVFANAPDKRFMIHSHFSRDADIRDILAFAQTNEEKAAVWALAGIRNPGKAIENFRNVRMLQSSSPLLSLLLTREINKLEDWILTPYYSGFEPSLSGTYWENSDPDASYSRELIASDRAYAKRLLDIVDGTDFSKTENPELWKSAVIYLNFLTEEYEGALERIRIYEQSGSGTKAQQEQVGVFKALCLVAQQPQDNASIPDEAKTILLREHEKKNNRLLFALARELEFKGNTTDAAILLSKFTAPDYDQWGDYLSSNEQYWKSRSGFQTLYFDFYYDYFLYLDAEYTPAQIKSLIATVRDVKINDVYDRWKYADMKKEIPRLYDLLGTKYVRKDQLKHALDAFEKVNDTLWTSNHYAYATYLDANPFYTNMYNEHTRTFADNVRYNKESLTRKLIEYIGKAENPNTEHRDYYYFLVANCHLNMSYYGNSWMMKRYYSSRAVLKSGLEDDDAYYNCEDAKKFYLKAKSVSRSKKFRALCLRMAGRCEKYRLLHEIETGDEWVDEEETERRIFAANKYYKQIRTDYPEDYDELISNCHSFERYFESYKKPD